MTEVVLAERVVGSLAHGERILRKVAGAVLLVAGVHDTIVYGLL